MFCGHDAKAVAAYELEPVAVQLVASHWKFLADFECDSTLRSTFRLILVQANHLCIKMQCLPLLHH